MKELFLDELFDDFINNQIVEKDISKHTKANYSSDFKIFLNFLMEQGIKATVNEMNKNLLKKFFQYLKFEKNYATATMRRKIHCLSSFFKYLYQEEFISRNYMASIKAPKLPRELPIYVTREDTEKILNSIDKFGGNFILRDKCMFLLLFLTGMRRQELINLRWKDINFKDLTINIIKSKGKKSRQIPLLPPLPTYLQALLAERKCDTHDYVMFSNAYNHMSETTAETIFRKYIKKNNLDGKGYTLHKCRHAFATNLAMENIDSLTIAQILGHEDLNTTKVYVHMVSSDLNNKIKDIGLVKDINKIL
ncbi:tyrosine-type recombinase/integrase [Clostridium neuense]|uniref:Tyrosine-type recombinase/integrase n=1 Tax=Clostridium neuense TaxID=1728934 RepID=A0ABW8TF44_9CLOT